MTQRKKNHKPKSNQYIFINETRLCGSLASPLILQTNLVYNNQISCGCFCANKGGTWENRALQAPPVSAPTWDGLFWSLNKCLAHCSWSSEFQSSKCLSCEGYSSYCGDLGRLWAGVVQISLMQCLFQGCSSPPMGKFRPWLLRKAWRRLRVHSFLQLCVAENSSVTLEISVHPIGVFLPLILFSLSGLNLLFTWMKKPEIPGVHALGALTLQALVLPTASEFWSSCCQMN